MKQTFRNLSANKIRVLSQSVFKFWKKKKKKTPTQIWCCQKHACKGLPHLVSHHAPNHRKRRIVKTQKLANFQMVVRITVTAGRNMF